MIVFHRSQRDIVDGKTCEIRTVEALAPVIGWAMVTIKDGHSIIFCFGERIANLVRPLADIKCSQRSTTVGRGAVECDAEQRTCWDNVIAIGIA